MTQRGFTLVEVLVVLVIVALVALLLTQGLGQIFTAREKLGPYIDQSEDTARIGIWFRQIAGGVVPDTTSGPSVFVGSASGAQGLTLTPTSGAVGAPTPFQMQLVQTDDTTTALRISSYGGATIDLFSWKDDQPGADQAGFAYFDGTNWFDHWPLTDLERHVPLIAMKSVIPFKPPQVPKLIRLTAVLDGRPWVLVANPHGPELPLATLADAFR